MNHNLEDAVAAHAIGALPPDEAAIVEATIHVDPDLRREYESHRRVAAELARGFPEVIPAMSPDLWSRITDDAGLHRDDHSATTERRTESRRPRLWSLASAAAIVVVVALSAALVTQRSESPTLGDLAALAAAQPNAVSVSLEAPESGQDVMRAVVTEDGSGYLTSDALPVLSPDRTYQLWVIVDDRIVSAGVLGSSPSVSAFRVEGNLAGLAVTEEVAGGVAVSESEPVALWLAEA